MNRISYFQWFRKDRCIAAVGAAAWLLAGAPGEAVAGVDYAREIQPLFQEHCGDCHGGKMKGGFRIDLRKRALQGGDSGEPGIVPGKPEASRIVRLMKGEGDERMPPKGEAVPPEDIARIEQWIREGAHWPDTLAGEAEPPGHWAFRPPERPEFPAVSDPDWPRNGIDWFVLARLDGAGLKPAPEADRYALIRRLSLDLTGLPPTPGEVEAFVNDRDPDALGRLVDRLLSSSAYGERWAGVWLDLARYADSKGYASDPLREIWRYRDWAIEAFNRNLPYDEFTRLQLAGDLLPDAGGDALIATAFHRNTMNNTEGGTDDEEFRVVAVKDRVNTTLQVWMGLTMGCAECHSHKYDPITQREYYSLYAYFNQTADADKNDDSPTVETPTPLMLEERRRIDARIAELKRKLDRSTPELEAAQTQWEKAFQSRKEWQVLEVSEAESRSGAELGQLDDGSLLVSGGDPDTDTYTVSTKGARGPEAKSVDGWTAFRLEAIPHESLPGGGVGRGNGNMVLSRFSVTGGDASSLRSGRFVRVEIPGREEFLSLAEVQVFSNGENIAGQGTASQSSTDYEGKAGRAIDGRTDGHYFEAQSTTHTAKEKNPWWEADLGAHFPVDRIVVWNRSDGSVGSRLSGWRISLLNGEREEVWSSEVEEPPDPSRAFTVSGAQPVELVRASASFEQKGFPVAHALKAPKLKENGWALAPNFRELQSAVFVAASPVGTGPLTFRLEHRYKEAGYTLGRFRLSATDDPVLIRRQSLPANILALIDTPSGKRTGRQEDAIAGHYRSIAPLLKPVRAQIAQLEKSRPKFPVTPVLRELPPGERRETFLMVKGNFMSPGDPVKPGLPDAFSGFFESTPENRAELVDWLMHPDNPLTARVAVNRFWSRLFGRGIVETEEDFGTQGEPPTHPELLDWLATEFVRLDWDMKALLKTLVCSATYRQSAGTTPAKLEKDLFNRLFSRGPRFRLDAERVRDQALALSGLLSRKIGGPSVYPPQPPGLWRAAFNGRDRKWPTDTGEDRYRRGLYTFWRRTIPYPSMAAFDAPSREICSLRRIRTNTPLQAFVTLNDPVYVEASQALARRIVDEGGATNEERVQFALRLCLCRPPDAVQAAAISDLLATELEHYRAHPDDARKMAGTSESEAGSAELAAWTVVGNVLLNLDGVLSKG